MRISKGLRSPYAQISGLALTACYLIKGLSCGIADRFK